MGKKKLKLIRKNIVANTLEHFAFDMFGFEFLVKNFTDSNIYVAFEETANTSEMIKIPAKCDETCLINKGPASDNFSKDVYIYAENSGEVEVQCVKF